MITLITGLPGSGKTLYCLSMVNDLVEKEGRTVFYNGITDLTLPWVLWSDEEVKRWQLVREGVPFSAEEPLPHKGAVIVIDECQRLFRVRSAGSAVPDYVAALERHRHQGLDFVLITQHPMLIDSNVRRLAGRHFHAVSAFGAKACTLHEWSSVKEACDKQRADSIRHIFKYPAEVYGWYKSAEIHTHKRRIPAKFWFLVGVPLVLSGLGYGVYHFMAARIDRARGVGAGSVTVGSDGRKGVAEGPGVRRNGREEYLAGFVPVVPGLPHTAPRYEQVLAVRAAPYPVGCISGAKGCRCYSEQGTVVNVSVELCRGIVEHGMFREWETVRGDKKEVVQENVGVGQVQGQVQGRQDAQQSGETWGGVPAELPAGPMPPGRAVKAKPVG